MVAGQESDSVLQGRASDVHLPASRGHVLSGGGVRSTFMYSSDARSQ